MEKSVRRMLTNNVKQEHQVLIVPAGHDTLAYHLAKEFPSTPFWEVDHPATSIVKKEAIHIMGESSVSTNLHLVAADVTNTKLQDVLSNEADYDTNRYSGRPPILSRG